MEESLWNAWWVRWAVLALGIAITWFTWTGDNESFRGERTVGEIAGVEIKEDEPEYMGGINRIVFLLFGIACIVAGLAWPWFKRLFI
jgi:hypothetical protein